MRRVVAYKAVAIERSYHGRDAAWKKNMLTRHIMQSAFLASACAHGLLTNAEIQTAADQMGFNEPSPTSKLFDLIWGRRTMGESKRNAQ
jgi:hypothetical protein